MPRSQYDPRALTQSRMRVVTASIAQEQDGLDFLVPALHCLNGGLTPEMRRLVLDRAREASDQIIMARERRATVLEPKPLPSIVTPDLLLESEK